MSTATTRTRKTTQTIDTTETQEPGSGRVYAKELTFDHDLFKLELSKFKKNIAVQGDVPNFVDTEHVHWFHTVDSDGKQQLYSNPVGGHFHVLEIIPSKDPSQPPTVKCATGPVKFVKRKGKYGKIEKVIVPFNDEDDHRHEITYVKSDKIKARTLNVEAVKVASVVASHTSPIPGVQG